MQSHQVTPLLPAIVEDFGRAILPRRVTPSQPVLIYNDNAAQHLRVFVPRLAMALREEGLRPFDLIVGKSEKIAYLNTRQFGS